MKSILSIDDCDEDMVMENYIKEYDKTVMPIPDVEFEPFILLNKVRKHYMGYIIKLLSVNYERNLNIPGKKTYRLPSAIWRCAKGIELSAAQTSMVLQIYRRNILSVVEELKSDTKAGRMNRKLYDSLYRPPLNEKRTQTTLTNSGDCNCQCSCYQRKRVKKTLESSNVELSYENDKSEIKNNPAPQLPIDEEIQAPTELNNTGQEYFFSTKSLEAILETQASDELERQLEKLFEGDEKDDDLYESVLCDESQDKSFGNPKNCMQVVTGKQDPLVEAHSAQIKSLDERLVSLSGLLINSTDKNTPEKQETPVAKIRKMNTSKWLCEEYFLKMKLFQLLDQIRDFNRNRLKEIKLLFVDLFGEDEEEDLMSPMDETPEFVLSCKERIAPWVVKMLTPYYIKGRIKGKALFKALAKHLIRLIYQCSQYPEEYEVHSFVSDFLKTHKVIRCEADFKEFRIMNI